MIALPKLLPPPASKPHTIPSTAEWLAGEGAGSWFFIEKTEKENEYHIIRYAPDGKVECKGQFISEKILHPTFDFEITYPSHCLKVTAIQQGVRISFHRKRVG